MSDDWKSVSLRPGELLARCERCGLWGRKSPVAGRSNFRRRGVTTAGNVSFSRSCHRCSTTTRRLRERAKKGEPRRRFSNDVYLMDDFGDLRVVRLCTTCFHWLPSSEEFFDRRGNQRVGLGTRCKVCRRAKQRGEYHANPEPRRRAMRERHQRLYAENESLERALKAHAQGRSFKPRRPKPSESEQWLPIEPLRGWLDREVAAHDELTEYGSVTGGSYRIAAAVGAGNVDSWVRKIHRLRYELRVASLSDADALLSAVGSETLHSLYPDLDTALREGYEIRFGHARSSA